MQGVAGIFQDPQEAGRYLHEAGLEMLAEALLATPPTLPEPRGRHGYYSGLLDDGTDPDYWPCLIYDPEALDPRNCLPLDQAAWPCLAPPAASQEEPQHPGPAKPEDDKPQMESGLPPAAPPSLDSPQETSHPNPVNSLQQASLSESPRKLAAPVMLAPSELATAAAAAASAAQHAAARESSCSPSLWESHASAGADDDLQGLSAAPPTAAVAVAAPKGNLC